MPLRFLVQWLTKASGEYNIMKDARKRLEQECQCQLPQIGVGIKPVNQYEEQHVYLLPYKPVLHKDTGNIINQYYVTLYHTKSIAFNRIEGP